MTNTLRTPKVQAVLDRLFAAAARDDDHTPARPARPHATAAEQSDACQDIYMPISAEAGRLLYALARAIRPQTVVEFGTSFGISTIHLAAAVTDNGSGRVVTTELSGRKAAAARQNLEQAGLAGVVTILQGDALETLASVTGPVRLVLLDGWKELYLPVLRLLQPRLSPGALIVADNTEMADTKPYLEYVRNVENGYVSVNFLARDSDSMEISCRAAG